MSTAIFLVVLQTAVSAVELGVFVGLENDLNLPVLVHQKRFSTNISFHVDTL